MSEDKFEYHDGYPNKGVQHCGKCRYDLSDQPKEYIEEFHMMAIRCPECGLRQPAGIMVQPWRYRKIKHFFMSATWLGLLSVAFFGMMGALAGMAQSTAYASLFPFTDQISESFRQHIEAEPESYLNYSGDSYNPEWSISPDWWEEHGRVLAQSSFVPRQHIEWIVLTDWFWFLLIAPIGAMLTKVLFFRASKLIQALFIALVIGGSFLIIFSYLESGFFAFFYGLPPIECAVDAVGYTIAYPTLVVGSIAYVASYLCVVPITRRVQHLIPRLPDLFPPTL